MKKLIQSIKGTRDFYPEEMATRSWLYSKVRTVSHLFGYQEYEGPLLESIELYAAKSGEELVKEQSFVFPDRGGDLITLRPELTPSLARMVAQRQKELVYPLRWWSFGPFWRYERPQKGRAREFFQWNIDLIGVSTPEADAEMIAIIATFFKEVGLPSNRVKILINDRQLIENELNKLEIPPNHYQDTFRLIDRKDKLSSVKWKAFASEKGLKENQINRLNEILANDQLWRKSENMSRIFTALQSLGARDYVSYDPSIIRGLDYYTSTVFEAKEWAGDIRRSILGGGRYDNLLADVGGDPLPAVGFAMGDVVLTLILKSQNCIPEQITHSPAEIIITIFNEECLNESLVFANELRQAKLNTICYPEATNLGKQFKYASKIQAKFAVIIGPEEIDHDEVSIKDLRTGIQNNIPRAKAVSVIRSFLDNVGAS